MGFSAISAAGLRSVRRRDQPWSTPADTDASVRRPAHARMLRSSYWVVAGLTVLLLAGIARHTPLLWTASLTEMPTAVAVDSRTERVFVATSGPDGATGDPGAGAQVQVFNLASGNLLRSVPLDADPLALAVDEPTAHLFLVDGRQQVTILDAQTGSLVRSISVPGAAYTVVVDERTRRAFVACDGVADPNHGSVSILDTRSGRLVRTIMVEKYPGLLTLDASSDRVLLSSAAAQNTVLLHVLDASSGQMVRTNSLGRTSPTLDLEAWNSQAFMLSLVSRQIDLLDERTGTLRRFPLSLDPTALAVDGQMGQVFVIGADVTNPTRGRINVLDVQHGLRRDSLSLEGVPIAAAVDGPTGRLVVASSPAVVRAQRPWWQPLLPLSLARWLPWLALGPQQAATMRFVVGTVSLVDTTRM